MMISPEKSGAFADQIRARRGRPRVIHGPVVVRSVRLPEPVYDAICRRAIRADQSVDHVIRVALAAYVRPTSVVEK